ncbi:MAG: hypothetical protein LBF04_04835 [Prevotellaceae bacterium]|nr:hypothetical protein [Prevotellaceae bacterium]
MYAQTQTKTAYEKKITEITTKYFKIFYGYNRALTMYEQAQIELLTDSELGQAFLAVGILGYAANHTETQVKSMVKQMEFDYKQAEKLKTSVDIQREKARKEEQARKEKEEAEQKAREIYLRSDKGKIEENIKTAFEKWAVKGEFESSAKYEERLKNQSQSKFTETCIEQIRERTNGNIYKELLPYDADNECFTIKFSKKCGYACGIEWQSKLNIPINQAKDFKGHFRDGDFYTKINDYDWCFVNDTLCPTIVTLSRGKKIFNREKSQHEFITEEAYNLSVTIPNQTEITVQFDNLGIDNQYLAGYVCKYSEIAKKKARERFIADSLCNDYTSKIVTLANNTRENIEQLSEQCKNCKDELQYISRDLYSSYSINRKICNETDFNKAKSEIVQQYEKAKSKIVCKEYNAKIRQFADINADIFEQLLKSVSRMTNDYSQVESRVQDIQEEIRKTANAYVCNDKEYNQKKNEIIDIVIANHAQMNKEYTKNGQLFENNAEFYNAYISGNYKQILKERKKK